MGRKRRMEDLDLHPDRKYRGVLYTPRSRTPQEMDDDLPGYRRPTGIEALGERIASFFASLFQKKQTPAAGGRPRREAPVTPRTIVEKRRAPQRETTSRGHRNAGGSSRRGPAPVDKLIRTVALVCAAVCVVTGVTVTTSFAKPSYKIHLVDDGREVDMTVGTKAETVGEFLEEIGVTVGEDDVLENRPDAPLEDGMNIMIWRGKTVKIVSGDQEYEVNMIAGTVAEALEKAGVEPSPSDEVYPSVGTYITPGMRIEHLVVEKKQRVDTYDIPYEETTKEDPTLAKGETEVVQWGEKGKLEITTEETYKNGLLVAEAEISEEVVREPVTEITAVGTYVPPPPKKKVTVSDVHSGGSSSGGSSSSGSSSGGSSSGSVSGGKYSRTFKVTAYCSACDSHGGKTASGTYASWGTLACNDFPIGTMIDIPGYGVGRVEDRMGSSGKIDVYLGQRDVCTCGSEWGSKTLEVTVLE